jgi:hypothetical protein
MESKTHIDERLEGLIDELDELTLYDRMGVTGARDYAGMGAIGPTGVGGFYAIGPINAGASGVVGVADYEIRWMGYTELGPQGQLGPQGPAAPIHALPEVAEAIRQSPAGPGFWARLFG